MRLRWQANLGSHHVRKSPLRQRITGKQRHGIPGIRFELQITYIGEWHKMSKINVLQLSNQLGRGGTERALQIFAETLDKNLFNVYICGIIRGGERERQLINKGFEVSIVGEDQERLTQFMKERDIQIAHIHRAGTEEPFAINCAKKAGVPVIVETNVFGAIDRSPSGRLIDHHLFVSKMCVLRYQRLVPISRDDFFKNSKVLYNPIKVSDFDSEVPPWMIEEFKSGIGLDLGDPVIGRIGRPDMRKWGNICIDMVSHLIKLQPSVKYVIVGTPGPVKDAISDTNMADNFVFLDDLSEKELVMFYKSIDVLAHSSGIGESFGYTLAEAMAAKKPVVVNSTPLVDNAQIELVDNNKTGLIANSPKTYAKAISHLLEDKQKAYRMGLAGYEKVKKEYEAGVTTKVLEKIYVDMAQRKGIDIGDTAISRYKSLEYFPSFGDLASFEDDYNRRLVSSFGGMDALSRIEVQGFRCFLERQFLVGLLRRSLYRARRIQAAIG